MSRKRVALLSYDHEKSYIEIEHEAYRFAEIFNKMQDEWKMEVVIWDKKEPRELKISYEFLLFKTIWDYHVKFKKFQEFLSECEEYSLHVLNPAKIVKWNCVKSEYLHDLRKHSVDIIPTNVINRKRIDRNSCKEEYWLKTFEEFKDYSSDSIVVKPSVSASSFQTKVFVKGECEDRKFENIERFVNEIRSDVLIQPLMHEVQSFGELSLFFVGGKYTHSVLKIPKKGDFRSQSEHGGSIFLYDLMNKNTQGFDGKDLIEFGEKVIRKVEEIVDAEEPILFCRIDVIVREKDDENVKTPKILLMEAELIEPSLYSYWYPEVNNILCSEILNRLKK